MKVPLLIAALTILSLPVAAGAQTGARMDATAETRTEIRQGDMTGGEAAIRANVAAGLPEAPVRRAIAEAEARGATRAEIDRAAMQAHTRLRVARSSLSGGRHRREASNLELTAGAEALASGATQAELLRVRDAAPRGRRLEASLTALAELNSRDFDGMSAATAIATRLRGGASDQAISSFAANARSAADLASTESGTSAATSTTVDAAAGLGGAVQSAGASLGASVGGGIF